MKHLDKKYNDEDNLLVNDLRSIVSKAFAAVNYSLVERNWRIGQRIVEQEQNGVSRAEYGKHVIEVASAALTEKFGKGFSETNIMNFKKFYLIFKNLLIPQTLSEELRLLMSKKKEPVVDEMKDKTKDYQQDKLEYIKSPVVLEFLGLPEDTSLAESKLESAIIDNLEK